MKLHARTIIVDKARHALTGFLLDLEQKHSLAYGEVFSCLADCASALARGMQNEEDVAVALATLGPRASKPRTEFDQALRVWVATLPRIQAEYRLTYGELLSLLGNSIASLAKYYIRHERHPDDPEKRGDEA